MMRVLIVASLPPSFGGMQVLAKALACELARRQLQVAVVTQRAVEVQLATGMLHQWVPFDAANHADLYELGIEVYPAFHRTAAGSVQEHQGATDTVFAAELHAIIERERPDLVHCHWGCRKTQQVVRVANDLQVPCVITLHGISDVLPRGDADVTDGMDQAAIVGLLEKSSHIISVSREVFDYCRSQEILAVTLIRGGVDTDFFHPSTANSRNDYLYVGKNRRHKGIREMCRAFMDVAEDVDDRLHLVGRGMTRRVFAQHGFFLDGAERGRFQEWVERERIELHDELPRAELRKLYQAVRALVLPSLTEGFPLAVLESLACGTPVIASDVGSVSDVVISGENGYLVRRGDITAVARGLLAVSNPAVSLMASQCRSSALPFDIAHVASQHIKLFQELIRK